MDKLDLEYNIHVINETLDMKTLPKTAAKNLIYIRGSLKIFIKKLEDEIQVEGGYHENS